MEKRAPWIWPVILIAGGIVLLLDNFLLIDIDLTSYWPVLLIVLGLQILLRGDIALSWQAHTFGITRGSVQAASIEIESGEIDVQLRALHKPGRLIAGQYTARSRPELKVRNNRATLRMQRGQTWWLSLADWDVGLAQDLPWGMLISSYLGRLEIDLRSVHVERAYVSSGLGSVTVACPAFADGPVFARSAFGDVRVSVPANSQVHLTIQTGPLGRVRLDKTRFRELAPGTFVSVREDQIESTPAQDIDLHVVASTTFGSIYIN
jgi:hypothetical protein